MAIEKIKHVGKAKSNNPLAIKVKTEFNNHGGIKTLVILGLIFLQLSFIVLQSMFLIVAFNYYSIIAAVLTAVACVHVLSSNSNGQAKATWVLFLLVCYSFGFIIYLLSNEKFLLRKTRKKFNAIFKKSEKYLNKSENINYFSKNSNKLCNYLQNSGNVEIYKNSKSSYFSSGSAFFDEVIEKIKNANKFIFIEFYIIAQGVLLNRILDALFEKAKQGVDIRIIYDDVGSQGKLKRKLIKKIKNAKIQIIHFNKLVPLFDLGLNLRNHRKIVVVDGKVCFTGGFNLADEYINEKQLFGYWKDSGIMVEGPAVDTLCLAFLRMWEFATGNDENYEKYLNQAECFESNSAVVPFVSGPEFTSKIARDMYINLISLSNERIWLFTPYFIPEETFTNLLIAKAKAGVDVRIILPAIADKKYVYVVSRDYAERLIYAGVKVYTMTNCFVHSKVLLVDSMAIVGSINLDLRSFYQQFESAVFVDDKNVICSIEQDFEKSLGHCEQITQNKQKRNNMFYRIIAGLLRILSPFM